MGDLAQPTPADRLDTQRLATEICDSVRNDEKMPLPIPTTVGGICARSDVETVIARLAIEISLLVAELERVRPMYAAAKKVVLERLSKIQHARESAAMCELHKAIVAVASSETVDGDTP